MMEMEGSGQKGKMKDLKMHPVFLRFQHPVAEEKFQRSYFKESLPILRVVLWTGLILNLFSAIFLDPYLVNQHIGILQVYRYLVITPLMIAMLFLVYRYPASPWTAFTLIASAIVIGLGLLYIMVSVPPEFIVYYFLVFLTLLLALFVVLNVRYLYLGLVGWTLIVSQLFVFKALFNINNFLTLYLSLTGVLVGFLGTLNAFIRERYARKNYQRLWILDKERRRLNRLNRRLKRIAIVDELTRLYNRRHLMQRLEETLHLCRRHQKTASLILLDLDNFKELNDEHGHLVGDRILRAVAERLKSMVRRSDTLFRFGGDEFIVLLPETDLEQAVQMAHRLIRSMRVVSIKEVGHFIPISCSAGVTVITPGASRLESVMRAVDRALYRAKWKGKACVSWVVLDDHGREPDEQTDDG